MDAPNQDESLAFGRRALDAEADAIKHVALDARFAQAVECVLQTTPPGSVIVTGLGKSGLIGQKLAATFASTGTPSHFVHATEAMHGDVGRIRREDVVVLLSYSGNTEEVVALAEVLRQDGVKTVAITSTDQCDLGRLCDLCLPIGDVTEACALNLAPSASTTATLALGDALALTVSNRRAFKKDDFRRLHPGGGLGKQTMPIVEAMRFKATGKDMNMPLIAEDCSIRDAYDQAERVSLDTGIRRAGALVVVDASGKLAGIFTDGDLRRHVFAGGGLDAPMSEVMTKAPKRLTTQDAVRDAVRLIRELRIDEAPVVDEAGQPVGLIDVQDLVALKVIEG